MSENAPIIDTCVTPFWRSEVEPHLWMSEPWASKRHMPGVLRQMYTAPTGIAPYGEYLEEARPDDDASALPGSSVSKILAKLDRDNARVGVLSPLTRGPQPDIDMATELCAATNQWLANTWLDAPDSGDRFLGTIRVNPSDPDKAVAEIEKWADHPHMVQIGVPLDAWRPYGHRNYFPIWKAAAELKLPVVIHADGGAAANYKPTMAGYPTKHIEYASQENISGLYHLASFILEGVVDRLPDLRVVFGDGAFDLLMPFLWRMDGDWGISRHETPWVSDTPSEHLDHFRFRTSRFEAPTDQASEKAWLEVSRAEELLIYGSNYPHWSSMSPADLPSGLSSEGRERILSRNAADLYEPRLRALGNTAALNAIGVQAVTGNQP
ncbi:amidohydrolase family protein [Paenarthrobacter nitroguajacolicus]|uniref:amidohydrolase family protein n=1 Tax=Paenarthrobacter nitroguajacolicus TaxID=211146 RepID=UPI00248ACF87|nr:amidohydrolase family protein [Paenarthrobacter nitroguajacolicus]MDI2034185.1 hypothetical protein [Paenarthrobacter nitroguajacolicus]